MGIDIDTAAAVVLKEKNLKKICVLFLCVFLTLGEVFAAEVEQLFRVGPQIGIGWGSGITFADIGSSTLWTFNLGDVNLTTGVNLNIQDFVLIELNGVVGVSKDFAISATRSIRAGIESDLGFCPWGPSFAVALGADWRPSNGKGPILGAAVRYRGFMNLDNFSVYNGFSLPVSLGWKF